MKLDDDSARLTSGGSRQLGQCQMGTAQKLFDCPPIKRARATNASFDVTAENSGAVADCAAG